MKVLVVIQNMLFAFKDTSLLESKIVDVIKVEWNISKDDLLKPRIKIDGKT